MTEEGAIQTAPYPTLTPWVHTPASRALTRLLIVVLPVQGWPLWELRQTWPRERLPWPQVLQGLASLWSPAAAAAAAPATPATHGATRRRALLRSASTSRHHDRSPQHNAGAPQGWGGEHGRPHDRHHGPSGTTVTLFGPEDYVRDRGKPVVVTVTFPVTESLSHTTLRIDNGGLEGQYARVSSAVVTLNGVVVVAPSAFNKQVAVIEKSVTLTRQNTLSVEVRSQPGSGFTLQIVGDLINHAPVAHAGPDQTARIGQTVQLDGSRSSDADGDALTFQWKVVTRPHGSHITLADAQAVRPTFVVDRRGPYVVQLIVKDGIESSAPDKVVITTENTPPVARAGPDQRVVVGTTVTLNGSKSSDVDGDRLTFFWAIVTQPPGSQAILSHPEAVKPTFVVDIPGLYEVQMLVHDRQVASAPDTVQGRKGVRYLFIDVRCRRW